MDLHRKRQLAAFYSPANLADFIARWSIRDQDDTILDPSMGDGVLLRAAAACLHRVGCSNPGPQLFGVDIDDATVCEAKRQLQDHGLCDVRLTVSDFFDYQGPRDGVSVVLMNPPFTESHQFAGPTRDKAQKRARDQGTRLLGRSAAWAAFVTACTGCLRPAGRLAAILPSTLLSADYAEPVREHLLRRFEQVTVVVFDRRVFPEVEAEIVLLLAEGRQSVGHARFRVLSFADATALPTGDRALNDPFVAASSGPWMQYVLPRKLREAAAQAVSDPTVCRLGDLASVHIGAVTGSNDFFALSRSRAEALGLPRAVLRRAIVKALALRGNQFTDSDWTRLADSGQRVYLLDLADAESWRDTAQVEEYISSDAACRVSEGYKCSRRNPWYVVPGLKVPQALLPVMAGSHHRLILNKARCVNTNSIHSVNFVDATHGRFVAATFPNTLTVLAAELRGRSYGGGVLKLEPGDAVSLPVGRPDAERVVVVDRLADAWDKEDRERGVAPHTIDRVLWQDMDPELLSALHEAREWLLRRRLAREQSAMNTDVEAKRDLHLLQSGPSDKPARNSEFGGTWPPRAALSPQS